MAYHKTPRPAGEYFRFGALCFDVDKAQQIIARKPREAVEQPVAEWAKAYHIKSLLPDAEPDHRVIVLGPDPRTFNRAYAITTDLELPVIIAIHEKQRLLVDGCNRLYKHYVGGSTTMSAFILTEAETRAIRIS
ncbi:hypothetical protein ACIGXM_14670 [Kitasatospora sp. NPDC052896]|uniref:hypothetical protein n=1 Tax=Kitasatospora sp. NPDC052896 TaxID=3364061 RepID=UPI0037C85438